jgi:hypothetical protein
LISRKANWASMRQRARFAFGGLPLNMEISTSVKRSLLPGGGGKWLGACSTSRMVLTHSGKPSVVATAVWAAEMISSGEVIQPARVSMRMFGIDQAPSAKA